MQRLVNGLAVGTKAGTDPEMLVVNGSAGHALGTSNPFACFSPPDWLIWRCLRVGRTSKCRHPDPVAPLVDQQSQTGLIRKTNSKQTLISARPSWRAGLHKATHIKVT